MTSQMITPYVANAVLAHIDDRRAFAARARAAAEGRHGGRRLRRQLRPRFGRRLAAVAAGRAAGPAGAQPSP
jgi:hypothetical protein